MTLVLKMLFALSSIGTVWGAYKLGQKMYSDLGGVLVAAAIALAPYRALNLFVRGAVSEAWAILFLPWILFGLTSLVDAAMQGEKWRAIRKHWFLFLLALSGMFLSHNLTTLMFLPITVFFAGLYWVLRFFPFQKRTQIEKKEFWQKTARLLFYGTTAFLLALCLSAFYLLPAFLEKAIEELECELV